MTNDIFTLGIGRVIASGYAMRQCIPYLSWAYRKPLQWIKSNGIELRKVMYVNYESVSKFLEKNTMSKGSNDYRKDARQWQNRLQTLREKSVAGINFLDALETAITREEYRALSDEQQRELIQAWLYPTNDEGEIETLSQEEDDLYDRLSDKQETDEDNREWYRSRAKEFEFHPMMTICGMCNEREANYNGITSATTDIMKDDTAYNGVIFQFCKICRDELQMIKLQTLASRP